MLALQVRNQTAPGATRGWHIGGSRVHLASLSAVAPLCRGTHPRQRAVRSIHGLAPRSSLGRSTSASVPRRRRRWSSRGPSCRSNSYSYPPCLVTRYVTFFDVFKVVSKVSMTTTLHLDKDLSPGTAPPIKEGTFGHRNSVSSRSPGRRPLLRAPHVLMVVDPLEKGEREKSVRGRDDVDPNAIEREAANETSMHLILA